MWRGECKMNSVNFSILSIFLFCLLFYCVYFSILSTFLFCLRFYSGSFSIKYHSYTFLILFSKLNNMYGKNFGINFIKTKLQGKVTNKFSFHMFECIMFKADTYKRTVLA